jgi:GntR family transcriptional regulator
MADPKYQQIATDLERQIRAGELAPGSRLRTEPEMQEKYGTSRNTVRDAVKRLVNLGLVETRPGQGTFVVKKAVPFVTTLSTDPAVGSSEGEVYYRDSLVKPRLGDTEVGVEFADAAIALELGLTESDEVVTRRQERYIDDAPWSIQTSFYPMKLVENGAQRLIRASNIAEGTVEYLRKTLSLTQARYRETITVRSPDSTEASFFGIPTDGRVQLLQAIRTAYDRKDHPIRLTLTVYAADRTRFVIDARVPGAALLAAEKESTAERVQSSAEAGDPPKIRHQKVDNT